MQNDRIAVEMEPHKATTAGGIHLPGKEAGVDKRFKFRFGKVVAAGPGRTEVGYPDNLKPMGVKVGDRVCFFEGAANPVKLEGKDYMLLGNDSVELVAPPEMDCSQVVFFKQAARI